MITFTDIRVPEGEDPLKVASEIYIAQCAYNDARANLRRVFK